jgi:isopentenyl diphosphate isomerase/L-lactate dehydrogenase-like FMN-dependent dehydrogenase
MRLDELMSVDAVERASRRRVPRFVHDAISGGSGDEWTLEENRRAFSRQRLLPKVLADNATRSLSTTILGESSAAPLLLAPTGFQRLIHPKAELASARAASGVGVPYVLSSVSSHPIANVAREGTGPRWFQLYQPQGGHRATDELLDAAEEAGFRTLCVTLDTTARALRERELRHGLTVPFRPSPRLALGALTRPRWVWGFLAGGGLRGRGPSAQGSGVLSVREVQRVTTSAMRPVTEADFTRIRARWKGPVVAKGVLRADQCDHLLNLGADGIIVSNHGGRLLDGVPATLDVLPSIVQAVNGRCEVFVDGGVRRGADVAKALALGASACLIGKAYLHGLALAGEDGVRRVLEILMTELDRTMGFLGVSSVKEIDGTHLWSHNSPPAGLPPDDSLISHIYQR